MKKIFLGLFAFAAITTFSIYASNQEPAEAEPCTPNQEQCNPAPCDSVPCTPTPCCEEAPQD